MELAEFERVYQDLREFHAFFAPTFGRMQWREHRRHYIQALLVQSQERRNAENLAETVPVSARALQRFLTEARWDDEAVTGRLQEYLSPRLTHPLAVWVFGRGRRSA
jgi:SRSO17 transposase